MTDKSYTKLPRLFIPDALSEAGGVVEFSEGQAHYLRHVMRLSAGDGVRLFNGQDGEWLASIKEINKKNCFAELIKQKLKQFASADIWLLASPMRKEPFELMIEKSSELGATCFVPVLCDHTVVHRMNADRTRLIATEAAEQCERLDVMNVTEPQKLTDVLKTWSTDRKIVFCLERADVPKLSAVAAGLAGQKLAVLIGPEGGFSELEIDLLNGMDAVQPVTLGSRILRAETAAIAALSYLVFQGN